MASSSSAFASWKYDVFLSFRGDDTRYTFTDLLYVALSKKGIRTFKDDPDLKRGEYIAPTLLTAIEESRHAIIILSENYASSKWCLEELVKILQTQNIPKRRAVPIFYYVKPSDVGNQRGSFEKAMTDQEEKLKADHKKKLKYDMKRVKEWKKALTQVGKISGFVFPGVKGEAQFIEEIVSDISKHLERVPLSRGKCLVGMDDRTSGLKSILRLESEEVVTVGIWGMSGIGKTTLAEAIYDQISNDFEGYCFLRDLKSKSKEGLNAKLLSKVLRDKNIDPESATTEARLRSTKALIVIDDVKQQSELQALIGDLGRFGPRSRIIITTRDKHLLTGLVHEESIYKVKELEPDKVIKLFNHRLLEKIHPTVDVDKYLRRMISYVQGLPLAVEVLAGSLCGRDEDYWKDTVNRLQGIGKGNLLNEVLQSSYKGLGDVEKGTFLDIACFFRGSDRTFATNIFGSCIEIQHLIDKSLITITGDDRLEMHDLLQEMGRQIVYETSPDEPGIRSRLWEQNDINNIFEGKKGTEKVEGIFLNLSNLPEINFTSKGFAKMTNLRLLKVYTSHISKGSKGCKVRFSKDFAFPSNNLRYLYWHGYSLKSMPGQFNPKELVEFNMPYSHIKQPWEGKKDLGKLKVMELSYSRFLETTPDLSRATNLERLVLEGCTSLHTVDPSLGGLKNLSFLSLKDCKSLRVFPSSIELESLQILILSGCSKLEKFREIKGCMKHLSKLFLDGTAIEELHPSIGEYATGLVVLDLTDCKRLKRLPDGICNLESLQTLLFSGCSMIRSLPHDFGKLKGLRKLHADRTSLREFPDSFYELGSNLQELSFAGSKRSNTSTLDFLFPRSVLGFLKDLNLSDRIIVDPMRLDSLTRLSSLKKLNLSENNFEQLPSLSQFPELTVLKLRNCKRLKELPDLPSSIEVINAHNCISLEAISNQWQKSTLLRHAIFTNCFRMKELHSNMVSSFGNLVAEIYRSEPRSYHQDYERPLVFRTLIPGSKIPNWFGGHQSMGDEVTIRSLPNTWKGDNFLGMAFCAVLEQKEMHFLTCVIEQKPGSTKKRMKDFIPIPCENGVVKSDHIWMGYTAATFYDYDDEEDNSLTVTFYLDEKRLLFEKGGSVKSCAVRLLYKEEFDMFHDAYITAAEDLSESGSSDHEDIIQSETSTTTDYYSMDEEDLSGSGSPDESASFHQHQEIIEDAISLDESEPSTTGTNIEGRSCLQRGANCALEFIFFLAVIRVVLVDEG